MNLNEKYKLTYKIARDYLFNHLPKYDKRLKKHIILKHLKPKPKSKTLNEVFRILVSSIANRQYMTNAINFNNNENKFSKILFNFDPHKTIKRYKSANDLLDHLKKHPELNLPGKQNKNNSWTIFFEGIISGAHFLSKFNDKKEFDKFVDAFMYSSETKAALPMILGRLIKGMGFALACLFLKNIGYKDYAKPDVHLITIFERLKLSKSNEPYDVYKAIVEMADTVGKSPYEVDAIFWLISSGNFYKVNIRIKGKREEFIKFVKKKLKANK